MKIRTGLTIVSVMAAIGGIATPVGAKSVWDQLNESAPRSIFDEIRDTAPRTIFDEIRDSAPVHAPDQDLVGE